MSEYVRKQALLEWLDDRRFKSPWIESFRERLESGAFDADESEGTWKTTSEFAFRLNDQLEAEVQRLRAALGHIHAIAQSELDDLQYEGQCKTWEEILLTAEEALKGDGNA